MILLFINKLMIVVSILLIVYAAASGLTWIITKNNKTLRFTNYLNEIISLMIFIWTIVTIANIVAIIKAWI